MPWLAQLLFQPSYMPPQWLWQGYMVARLYGVFFEGYDIAGSSFNVLALVGSVTLVGAGYWLSSKMTSKKYSHTQQSLS